jgi:plastocyanin
MAILAAGSVALLALATIGLLSSAAEAEPVAFASKVKTVEIKNFAFKPATLRVAKGTSVNFVNASRVSHTATKARAFNTGTIRAGKSKQVRFGQKGTFAYHCTIHPFMKGTIVVQ